LILFLLARPEEWTPGFFVLGLASLYIYRRFRHRRRHMLRRFTAKVQKLPEVRLVSVSGNHVTVVADKALAKTYVRVNALVDSLNGRMFFGDPFTVTVRDDVSPDETRAILSGSSVLFARDEG
jgi:hypothetical protein